LVIVQDEFEGPPPNHSVATQLHKHFNHLFADELQDSKVFSKADLRETAFKTKKDLFGWLVIFQPHGVKFALGPQLSSKFEGKFSSTKGQ